MKNREELNRLVVMTLETHGPMKARQLYGRIQASESPAIREASSYNSFTHVLKGFKNVQATGDDPKTYALK
jgi:hypothetical protein